MEDFYINNTSQDNSDNYSDYTSNSYYYSNTSNSYNYSNTSNSYNYSNTSNSYNYSNTSNSYNYSNTSNSYNYSNTSNSYNYSNTSNSYDYSNTTSNYNNDDYYVDPLFFLDVATYIISGIGLPLTLVAIYTLYSEVKNNHVAPIYVINLLISDLIQFCCLIVMALTLYYQLRLVSFIFSIMYYCSLMVSVCFMVCIALERFLVVVCPLWYRCRRSIKSSVLICVLVWVVPSVLYLLGGIQPILPFLLLPFPLFIFFLVGVLKALSASISVPSDEKRRIVGILVLVLLIYTLLFLPLIIWMLVETYNDTHLFLSYMFVRLSPLADLVLYIFMRKGIIEKILASVCCCRKDSNDISSSSV